MDSTHNGKWGCRAHRSIPTDKKRFILVVLDGGWWYDKDQNLRGVILLLVHLYGYI